MPKVVRCSVSGINETSTIPPSIAGDGQADAVERDRAALDDVALEPGGELDPDAAREAVRRSLGDTVRRVDVALDDVAAEPVGGADGGLEVDRRARLEAAERGQLEGLVHHVGGEAVRPSSTAVRQTPETATESPSLELAAEPGGDPHPGARAVAVDRLDASRLRRSVR